MSTDLLALQERLGHRFAQPALLLQALTHRSYGTPHNERLEFLGDSVLGVCVSDWLYQRLSDLPEGDLTRIRASLVREPTLHQLALRLGLSKHLRLGAGEARSGGAQRASILADALEALIGAVYLEGGLASARALVLRLYADVDLRPEMAARNKDAKTALQELLQGRRWPLPAYTVLATHGAEHQQTFDVAVRVPGQPWQASGQGPSRRAAEQQAAQALLAQLQTPLQTTSPVHTA